MCPGDTPTFPSELKVSHLPHFEIFGCPIGFATSDEAWCQAQLGLNSGGLGFALHSSSAYSLLSVHPKRSVNSTISSPVSQKLLSSKVNDHCFRNLFNQSSPANKARLLSVSAPYATSWLSVIPSTSQGLHLDPIEFRVTVKWWLGLDTSQGSQCAFCPAHSLDPLGHHAITCKCGGEVLRHNALRDTSFTVRLLNLSKLKLALGSSRPFAVTTCRYSVAEVESWEAPEVGATFGAVLEATESRKHQANDEKCSALVPAARFSACLYDCANCVKYPPLLPIELDHVVPDELHLLLRVIDVLLKNIINQAVESDIKVSRKQTDLLQGVEKFNDVAKHSYFSSCKWVPTEEIMLTEQRMSENSLL
ncbi:hypothetical protein EMCRGX_G001377 [Ephydatia muelleri]